MSQKNVVFKHRIEYLNQFCQRHLVKGNYISIQFPIQLSVFNIENAPMKLADMSCQSKLLLKMRARKVF